MKSERERQKWVINSCFAWIITQRLPSYWYLVKKNAHVQALMKTVLKLHWYKTQRFLVQTQTHAFCMSKCLWATNWIWIFSSSQSCIFVWWVCDRLFLVSLQCVCECMNIWIHFPFHDRQVVFGTIKANRHRGQRSTRVQARPRGLSLVWRITGKWFQTQHLYTCTSLLVEYK